MATNSWSRTGSAAWSLAADWSLAAVPAITDDVVVAGTASTRLQLSASTTVHSLTLTDNAATLALGGAVLTLSAGGTLSAGSVDGPGTLSMVGGSVGGLVLGGGASLVNSGSLLVSGTLALGDASGATGTIANQSGASLLLVSDQAGILDNYYSVAGVAQAGGGVLVNQGTLAKTGGTGTSHVYATLQGAGTVTASSGTLELDGGGTLAGSIGGVGGVVALGAGQFSLAASQTVTGALSLFGGTLALGAGQSLTLAGTVQFGSGSAAGASIDGVGTLVTSGYSVLVDDPQAAQLVLGGGLTWSNQGVVELGGAVALGDASGAGATIINQAGANLRLGNDDAELFQNGWIAGNVWQTGSATLVNLGTLSKTGGVGTSEIWLAISGAGTITASSGTLALEAGGTLAGSIGNAYGGVVALAGGVFSQAASSLTTAGTVALDGATLALSAGQTLTMTTPILAGGKLLGGTLALTGAGTLAAGTTLTLAGAASLVNQGSLAVSGVLAVASGGVIRNQTGASLALTQDGAALQGGVLVNGGILTKSAGTGTSHVTSLLQGNGTVSASSGTLELDGGGTLAGSFGGSGGVVALGAGNFSLGGNQFATALAVALLGGTLALGAGQQMSLGGSAALGGGGMVLDGAGTLATSGNADLVGGGQLQLGGGLAWLNQGSLQLLGTLDFGDPSGAAASLTNQSGASLVLGDGAVVQDDDITTSNGGWILGNGSLVNQGTLIRTGTGSSLLAAGLNSTGSLALQGGTLVLEGSVLLGGTISGAGTLAMAAGTGQLVSTVALNCAGLVLQGGALTVANGIGFGGALTLDGGDLQLSGAFAASGPVTLAGGTLAGPGTLTTSGPVTGGSLALAGGVNWDNQGSATLTSALMLADADGTVIDNAFGASMVLSGNGSGIMLAAGGAGILLNQGVLTRNGDQLISQLAATLISSGTLSITIGTLALAAGGTISGRLVGLGTLDLIGGTTTLASGVSMVLSHLQLNGGTLAVAGRLNDGGTVTLNAGGLSVASGATLTVHGSLTMAGATPGALVVSGPGTLATAGTVALGDADLEGGLSWRAIGPVLQTGMLAVGSGANLLIQAGGKWSLTDDAAGFTTGNGSGQLTNQGRLSKTGGTGTSVVSDNLISSGTIIVSTGTLALEAGGTLSGPMTGAGVLLLGGGRFALGANGVGESVGFGLGGGTLAMTARQNFTVNGAGFATGGEVDGPGTFTTNATLSISGTVGLGGSLLWNNNGQMLLSGTLLVGDAAGSAAHIVNEAKGTINLTSPGAGILDAPWFEAMDGGTLVSGSLVNAGTLIKSGGGTSQIGVSITSTGGILVSNGTLALDGGGTLSGALSGAGTLLLSGGRFSLGSGFGGVGTLLLEGALLSLAGNVTDPGALSVAQGTLSLAGASLTVGGALSLSAALWPWSEIDGGTLLSNGATSVFGGSVGVVLGGGLVWENGGSLVAASSILVGDVAGAAASLANLAGASFTLMSGAGIYDIGYTTASDTSAVGNASFSNAGLLAETGSGDSVIQAILSNSGTLAVTGGTLDLANASFSSTGRILLSGGGLLRLYSGVVSLGGTLATGAGGGTLAPGVAAGALLQGGTLLANLDLAAGATLDIDLAGSVTTLGGAMVLEGPGAAARAVVGGTPVGLVGSVTAIAASGALRLLGGAGWNSGTLADSGVVQLAGGGTLVTTGLTIGQGGLLQGNGLVIGAVANAGSLDASGGVLRLAGPLSGNAPIGIEAGAWLELASLIGTPTVRFLGSGATLVLDQPVGFAGTLSGLAAGENLLLEGIAVSAASISGSLLTVQEAGATLHFALSGGGPVPAILVSTTQSGSELQFYAGTIG